jgi:hypothetical protein
MMVSHRRAGQPLEGDDRQTAAEEPVEGLFQIGAGGFRFVEWIEVFGQALDRRLAPGLGDLLGNCFSRLVRIDGLWSGSESGRKGVVCGSSSLSSTRNSTKSTCPKQGESAAPQNAESEFSKTFPFSSQPAAACHWPDHAECGHRGGRLERSIW